MGNIRPCIWSCGVCTSTLVECHVAIICRISWPHSTFHFRSYIFPIIIKLTSLSPFLPHYTPFIVMMMLLWCCHFHSRVKHIWWRNRRVKCDYFPNIFILLRVYSTFGTWAKRNEITIYFQWNFLFELFEGQILHHFVKLWIYILYISSSYNFIC